MHSQSKVWLHGALLSPVDMLLPKVKQDQATTKFMDARPGAGLRFAEKVQIEFLGTLAGTEPTSKAREKRNSKD